MQASRNLTIANGHVYEITYPAGGTDYRCTYLRDGVVVPSAFYSFMIRLDVMVDSSTVDAMIVAEALSNLGTDSDTTTVGAYLPRP